MLDRLRAHALAIAERSHVPYSNRPAGVAALLASGAWAGAPRIENASFPLTVSALQGAWALALLAGGPLVAVAASRPFTLGERAFLDEVVPGGWDDAAPDAVVRVGTAAPTLRDAVPPTEPGPAPVTTEDGLQAALDVSARAVVPASAFPVGAVVVGEDGRWTTGANVEHEADWTRGLCAERVALVAAQAGGVGRIRTVYVACALAPGGSPCGGCRQVLAELAPDADVVVWNGGRAPRVTAAAALLPGAFGPASFPR